MSDNHRRRCSCYGSAEGWVVLQEVVHWTMDVLQMTFIFYMSRKQGSKQERHHRDLTVSYHFPLKLKKAKMEGYCRVRSALALCLLLMRAAGPLQLPSLATLRRGMCLGSSFEQGWFCSLLKSFCAPSLLCSFFFLQHFLPPFRVDLE